MDPYFSCAIFFRRSLVLKQRQQPRLLLQLTQVIGCIAIYGGVHMISLLAMIALWAVQTS